MTRSNIRIPPVGSIYSFNDAYADSWNVGIQKYVNDFRSNRLAGSNYPDQRKPSARYMGALVADVHNILFHGGIYGYPATATKPNGKLRLLYEANPLAMVMEEAGGMASNGKKRILDLEVHDIHQRTPLFLGGREEITILEHYESLHNSEKIIVDPAN